MKLSEAKYHSNSVFSLILGVNRRFRVEHESALSNLLKLNFFDSKKLAEHLESENIFW